MQGCKKRKDKEQDVRMSIHVCEHLQRRETVPAHCMTFDWQEEAEKQHGIKKGYFPYPAFHPETRQGQSKPCLCFPLRGWDLNSLKLTIVSLLAHKYLSNKTHMHIFHCLHPSLHPKQMRSKTNPQFKLLLHDTPKYAHISTEHRSKPSANFCSPSFLKAS